MIFLSFYSFTHQDKRFAFSDLVKAKMQKQDGSKHIASIICIVYYENNKLITLDISFSNANAKKGAAIEHSLCKVKDNQ